MGPVQEMLTVASEMVLRFVFAKESVFQLEFQGEREREKLHWWCSMEAQCAYLHIPINFFKSFTSVRCLSQ